MDALKKAARRAELPEDWVPHDLRHLRITTWIEAGQDVSLVRDAVGHADISTTNYYTHVRRKHLAPLADHGLESRMREDEPAEDELSQGTRTGT
jgi:site-specific recombinase XerD